MADPHLTHLCTSFISPATPSRPSLLFLSSLDILWRDFHYNRRLLFYHLPHLPPHPSLIETLKSSLSAALVHFYPAAGRLTQDGNGRTTIDCNDRGVEFVEAAVDLSFRDLEGGNFQMQPFFNKLAPYDEHPPSEIYDLPLMSFQVTQFKCGGICLGYAHSHVIADGHSMWHFMNSWAECARGMPISMPPLHIRDTFKVENPSEELARLNFKPSVGTREEAVGAPCHKKGQLVQRLFHFSADAISKLKVEASKGGSSGRNFTSYEVLCAHMWKSITRARRLEDEKEVHFTGFSNLRSRLKTGVPGYYGNLVIFGRAYARAGEVVREALAATAERIHEATASCNEETMWGTINWLELHGNTFGSVVQSKREKISAVSSPRFPVYGVDFGWGKPAAVRAAKVKGDGEMVLFPGRLEGVDICMPLDEASMERLHKDPLFSLHPPQP